MKYLFLISLTFLLACGSDDSEPIQSKDWLIPQAQVLDGGPGKDGIPSVDSPNFSSISDIDFLTDTDLVIGMVRNGIAKAYPHPILDWHEIVNDEIAGAKYALTYCPLTGTATAWDRVINGEETTFGVSGKLYNTNLIPYDRLTDSYWSQIRLDCVNGELSGTEIELYPIIETNWRTWKEAFPSSLVQNTDTGFSRNYQSYPYGDYRTNNDNIIFPVTPSDSRLPAKERVLGLLGETVNRVYSIESFTDNMAIEDNFDGKEILVIGSKKDNYVVAYEKSVLENVQALVDELPAIAEDSNGNRIDLSGKIISGPMSGEKLEPVTGFMGYYFSLAAFYPGIEIYE